MKRSKRDSRGMPRNGRRRSRSSGLRENDALTRLAKQLSHRRAGGDLLLAQLFCRDIASRALQHLGRPPAWNEANAGFVRKHEVAGIDSDTADRHRLIDGNGFDAPFAGDRTDTLRPDRIT